MQRRRALVVGLAGFLTACAGPAPTPAPTEPRVPTAQLTPAARPTEAPPTPVAAPPTPLPTVAPTATAVPAPVPPTPTPEPETVALDVRVWNGAAELQLDGGTIDPGQHMVSRGPHQAAALVDGQVVSVVDADPNGGAVDLFVPPPLASLAIMIENQADARPQTGLTSADVVYEALAEGGITRFISVYLSGNAPVVGPVRSLRHYFAFLAADYGADVVHIGASPEGFAWRDAMNMGHLDESAGDPGVWRVRTRPPPHNAYTDTAADRGFLAARGRQNTRSWGPLRFSADLHLDGAAPASRVDLRFRPWPYRVTWQWDAASERYLRFMEGAPHRDAASGEQISAAAVVCQSTYVWSIPGDDKFRLDMNLVGGSGDLAVFSGGTHRGGTWSKDAPRSSTVWRDAAGRPLVLPPGPVWVEVLPLESPVTISTEY